MWGTERYSVHPEDRVLVAVVPNLRDWELIQNERWYRVPAKNAPAGMPDFDYLAFYFPKVFDADGWAIHYYAGVQGHELVTRKDIFPREMDHPRASQWYYKMQIGPLQHRIPAIVSRRWRRVSFIVTSGDRFMDALEINDLLGDRDPSDRPFVTLRETKS